MLLFIVMSPTSFIVSRTGSLGSHWRRCARTVTSSDLIKMQLDQWSHRYRPLSYTTAMPCAHNCSAIWLNSRRLLSLTVGPLGVA